MKSLQLNMLVQAEVFLRREERENGTKRSGRGVVDLQAGSLLAGPNMDLYGQRAGHLVFVSSAGP